MGRAVTLSGWFYALRRHLFPLFIVECGLTSAWQELASKMIAQNTQLFVGSSLLALPTKVQLESKREN